jgi:integrase
MENVNITFYLNVKGKFNAIYMCVTCPQSPRYQVRFPHFTCEKKDWAGGRFKIGRGNSTNRQKQQRLDNLMADTHKFIVAFLKKHNTYPSKADLDFYVQKGEAAKKPIDVPRTVRKKGGKSIVEEVQKHIAQLENGRHLVNSKQLKPATIHGYRQILNVLMKYEQLKNVSLTADMLLKESTIRSIELYLTNDKQLRVNTVGKRLSNFKTLLEIFHRKGLLKFNPFKFYAIKIPKEDVYAVALTEEEFYAILYLDLSDNKTYELVRDHFVCMCLTGLRISDYQEFVEMEIKRKVIDILTIKTGVDCSILILPPMRKILDKYNGKLPKTISEQKMSQYIKEIAKRVPELHELVTKVSTIGGKTVREQIPKYQMISNHTARRTMVTLFSRWGVAEHDIMAITGHRDHRSLRYYNKMRKSEKALNVLNQIQHRFDSN